MEENQSNTIAAFCALMVYKGGLQSISTPPVIAEKLIALKLATRTAGGFTHTPKAIRAIAKLRGGSAGMFRVINRVHQGYELSARYKRREITFSEGCDPVLVVSMVEGSGNRELSDLIRDKLAIRFESLGET